MNHQEAKQTGPPRLLTKPEMAEFLRVSVRTLAAMMQRGEIPYSVVGKRLVRFRLEDVVRKLGSQEETRSAERETGNEVKKVRSADVGVRIVKADQK